VLRTNKTTRKILELKRPSLDAELQTKVNALQEDLSPGSYQLEVSARVQGYSRIFTYLNDYRLRLKPRPFAFEVIEARRIVIDVEFVDQGGTKVDKRLNVQFHVRS
jgi:hypothetical protein